MVKAFVITLIVGRIEVLIAFLCKAVLDPIGTKWQAFLDTPTMIQGIAVGWVFGLLTVGIGIAYADRLIEGETTVRSRAYYNKLQEGGIQADRHRFW